MADASRQLLERHLLENTGWMRSLALALVRDEATAEDVVQDAVVAALESPPAAPVEPRAWLRAVVRKLASLSLRRERRRRRRERLASRREALPAVAGGVLERAETHRTVVDAVLGLDEPYRSAVLLRYFDGLSPRDIARGKGVPAATVRTWLHRALERLRTRLASELGGKDQAWRLPLVLLAGLNAAHWASRSAAAAGSKTAPTAMATAGTIMTSKTSLATLFALLLTLALGGSLLFWNALERFSARERLARLELDALRATHAMALAEIERLRSEAARLEAEDSTVVAVPPKDPGEDAAGGEGAVAVGPEETSTRAELRAALRGFREFQMHVDTLWDLYHYLGDLDGLEALVTAVDLLFPQLLLDPEITDAERRAYERALDLNGFRKGYVRLAKGDVAAAREAFLEHIEAIDVKEAELRDAGGSLDKVVEIFRMRSRDLVRVVDSVIGRPAPVDFDLGEGWLTEKHTSIAGSRGKTLAIVFRGGDDRSGAFVGPISQFCMSQPDMEAVNLSYFTSTGGLEKAREDLRIDLARVGFVGAAGVDPDGARQSIFRQFQATVGTATFFIVNPRGEVAWVMRDPRQIDVAFAMMLLKRAAGR